MFKQTTLYTRNKRVYVKHGGGFIEVRHSVPTQLETLSGAYSTSHPDVQVLDYEVPEPLDMEVETELGQKCLRWMGGAR